MRLYLNQDLLDDFFLSQPERNLSESLIRPLSEFPGEVWSDCDFEELTLADEKLFDLCEWSYSIPGFRTATAEVYAQADDAPPRIPVHLNPSIDTTSVTVKAWSDHLRQRRSSGKEYVFGTRAPFDMAHRDFSILGEHRHRSSFALLVDPYLFAEGRGDAAVARQIAAILQALLLPESQSPFILLIAARWSWAQWNPVTRRNDPASLANPAATELSIQRHVINVGFGGSLRVALVNAGPLHDIRNAPRFHDRYLLTQQFVLTAGHGFAVPTKANRFTRMDIRYHAGSTRDGEAFGVVSTKSPHFWRLAP